MWFRGARAVATPQPGRRRRKTGPSTSWRAVAIAVALLIVTAAAVAATPAVAASAPPRDLPDAEIFATNNTSIITDPAKPQLSKRLKRFARKVTRIIDRGGGTPLRSQLLDGVFFSSDLNTTTFERSRNFDVDDVSRRELHDIADTIGRRFRQQSVLTFDYLKRKSSGVDAVELEVPGVTGRALRDGLLSDRTAREELFGGSVTRDGRLLLVAELADARLARKFAARIGGDLSRGASRPGNMEFVEPAR